jgi:hypothetical protein
MFGGGGGGGGAGGGGGGGGEEGAGGPLAFLRTHPQFQLMRRAVQANPAILVPMLQELGKQNPELLQSIQAHQQEFMAMVMEPAGGEWGLRGGKGRRRERPRAGGGGWEKHGERSSCLVLSCSALLPCNNLTLPVSHAVTSRVPAPPPQTPASHTVTHHLAPLSSPPPPPLLYPPTPPPTHPPTPLPARRGRGGPAGCAGGHGWCHPGGAHRGGRRRH